MAESVKPGWRSQSAAFGPLFLAVVLTVIYKLGDGYVMGHLITNKDKLLATLVYLSLGSMTGLTINYLMCKMPGFGKLIDPTFRGTIRGMSTRANWTALIAGILSAMATGIYLWSLRTLDPSLVVPLTSLAVLYVAIVEALRGRLKFGRVLPSIGLVFLGVAVASFNETANWAVTGEALLTVLLLYNVIGAISELLSKDGVDASDAVAYGFWRFFWLTGAAVTIAIGTSLSQGMLDQYLALLVGSLKAVPFIALLMVVVFFANGWAGRGLALSTATTKNLVMTSQVVLSVFATALVSSMWPGIFPSAPSKPLEWILRLIGAALLMWGVLRLRKND